VSTPFRGQPAHLHDAFLADICGRASFNTLPWVEPREQYSVQDDFRMLNAQIVALRDHLGKHRARGWRQIWGDNRYTEQWYAFWAIIVIGLVGLALSVVQVAQQSVQISLAQKALAQPH
jgi:hypothetical protein